MREARQVKYIIAIGDGMADLAQPSLRDETPLSFAHTPCLDRLARRGRVGSTCLIPPGCAPGSLPAQLTLLGCPPAVCGCGRAALEALAHGPLADGESAVRCNLVALSDGRLLAHDGGGLTADEADALFSALRDTLTDETHRFLPGAGYRGLLVRRGAPMPVGISPDALLGQPLAGALPEDDDLVRLFYAGQAVLTDHPVNQARAARGQHPANGIWFWGGGAAPVLPDFEAQTGLCGAVVTGVPLLRGIARGMGLTVLPVDGADGSLHTNWEGKAFATFDALTRGGFDFALVHAEAPDEAGHAGSLPEKVAAIEYFSERLLDRLTGWLDEAGTDYRLLVLADHPTPVSLRVHTAGPVPWLLYDRTRERTAGEPYREDNAGPRVPGAQMLTLLLGEE